MLMRRIQYYCNTWNCKNKAWPMDSKTLTGEAGSHKKNRPRRKVTL